MKLSSSIEFPKLLVKSVSQTTMNKKTEEKKVKILEKLGFGKKMEKADLGNMQRAIRSAKDSNNSNKSSAKGLSISQFSLGKKLGNGRFGSVYLAE